MEDAVYRDRLMDHYHNPRHRCTALRGATATAEATNPACGDTLAVQMRVADGKIADLCWTGEGCAISQAAASMLAAHIVGAPVRRLAQMDASAMLELLGVPVSPARMRCALLALETFRRALSQNN